MDYEIKDITPGTAFFLTLALYDNLWILSKGLDSDGHLYCRCREEEGRHSTEDRTDGGHPEKD